MIKKHYAGPKNAHHVHRRVPAAIKGKLSGMKPKPKPTQYPKGHPLSPTLEQDKWDTLNDFHNSVPNRLDAFDNKQNPFEEADPVLPDIPKAKPKFGLFESPW